MCIELGCEENVNGIEPFLRVCEYEIKELESSVVVEFVVVNVMGTLPPLSVA